MAENETIIDEKTPPSVNPTEKTVSTVESNAEVVPNKETPEVNETPESVIVQNDSLTTGPSETIETEATNVTTETKEAANDKATTETSPKPEVTTPSVEKLMAQLAEASQKAENYWDTLLRKQAEFDNSQKRMARELDNARKFALEKFATELLAVKDSMELGIEATDKPETSLQSVQEGMKLTLKMFNDALDKFNIKEINPLNDKFNPQWHEAMAMQPVPNVEDGTILLVHQKGYQLNERLLRPARVIVAQTLSVEKSIENQA